MKILKLLLFLNVISVVYSQNDTTHKYYRHLQYNHVSPYIQIAGIYPIDSVTAQTTSHYSFEYDESERLTAVINNHYHTEQQHPLTTTATYKVVITYKDGKETRMFYDKKGDRIPNSQKVYKEVYNYNANGTYNQLRFYDLNNNPMESNWGIAEYQWKKKRRLIIEKRFNLKKEAVKVSPYLNFGITGISTDKKGRPKAHHNLDEKLKITENADGIASLKDMFDADGNHVEYSYHDSKGKLIMSPGKFAAEQKIYDTSGNLIQRLRFDANRNTLSNWPAYTNSSITLSAKASQKDSAEIQRKSLGYLIALQQLKPRLMDEVMNDSLNKVTIGYNRKSRKEYARATTKKQMIEFAKSWNKANNKFPVTPDNQITILDIYNRIATVKLVSDNWVEYLHLIKLDGNWEIINLVWQHKDINRYPKE